MRDWPANGIFSSTCSGESTRRMGALSRYVHRRYDVAC